MCYNQTKLDKQVVGQSSTSYMSLKTHPCKKSKLVRFHAHKLLDNQTDGLAKDMDKMNTRAQGRQNQHIEL